jgi:hypothetical protein
MRGGRLSSVAERNFGKVEAESSILSDGTSAGLAQQVEQRFCKPKVGGSIPSSSTIFGCPWIWWAHKDSNLGPSD